MGDFTNKLTKKSNQSMQPQKVNIDISKTKLVKCECGSPLFQQAVVFREVSGILVGQAGQNVQNAMTVLICMKCEKPHSTSAPYLQDNEVVEEPILKVVGK